MLSEIDVKYAALIEKLYLVLLYGFIGSVQATIKGITVTLQV
jgi:hypothetical protein